MKSSSYLERWAYVDGFGRDLQTQTPLADGSRAVVGKQYNNLGQLMLVSAPFGQSGAAGSNFVALGISDWETVANYHFLQYDVLGNLWVDATRSAASHLWSTTTIHDAWQTRTFDSRGNRTDYDQNAFGQLVKVTEYNVNGQVYNTTYGYDLQGNLTSVTDAANNVTTMTYDLLGRKLRMIDPDMGRWDYGYDAVGNLIGHSDGRLKVLHLEYDDLNRLIRKRRDTASTGPKVAEYFYDASGQKGLLDKSLAYDSAGTAVQVEVDAVTYDNRNRLTQQRWVVANAPPDTFRMDYAYNEADQRTSITYPGNNAGGQGETVNYTYNSVGQLTGVSSSDVSYISAATYNAQGQLTQMVNDTSPNGLTRQWEYEPDSLRLSRLLAGKNTVNDRQKLTYGYDNNGNVTSLIDGQNQDQKQCFQYDYLNRLTGAFTTSSSDTSCVGAGSVGVGGYTHSYGYNAIGNLTSYAGNNYSYGSQPHAVTGAFNNSYGYDANGNQTSRTISSTVSSFTYDYENRLTAISGGATASFVYDADGNRVRSTVGGVITVYIAGVFEFIENGNTDKMTTYYEGNAMRRSGYGIDDGVFYLLQDHLKSSSSFVNQSGATLANNYYYPYGGNRGGAFSNLTTKRFTGQYHESSLPGGEGLSYYNARWYDPKLGRFLSADTIVPGPANPQAFNRYSYVFNNPLKYTDPNGHCPSPSVPGGTGAENRAARAESGRCNALVNTILNSWDKTDYWQKKWPDKAAFKKHLGDSPTTDYNFFLPYWMESLAYEKQWDATHPSTPCTGCSGKVEQDFGDYTSLTFVLPLKIRQNDIGFTEVALIMDDHWNFYRRAGPGIGTPGFTLSRGDILILSDGKYVDIDTLNLTTDQESLLMQERMPGTSRGLSAGTVIFAGGAAISADGQTVTVEAGFGFPPSPASGFLAPNSVTAPWFSWR